MRSILKYGNARTLFIIGSDQGTGARPKERKGSLSVSFKYTPFKEDDKVDLRHLDSPDIGEYLITIKSMLQKHNRILTHEPQFYESSEGKMELARLIITGAELQRDALEWIKEASDRQLPLLTTWLQILRNEMVHVTKKATLVHVIRSSNLKCTPRNPGDMPAPLYRRMPFHQLPSFIDDPWTDLEKWLKRPKGPGPHRDNPKGGARRKKH